MKNKTRLRIEKNESKDPQHQRKQNILSRTRAVVEIFTTEPHTMDQYYDFDDARE